ncbi:MAG: hypothetical protein OEV48_13170 [Acidobacteriota bacterium]|jgi:hypothetical protein|nr:hypothetical protein [Acidobacteriota bacterium]
MTAKTLPLVLLLVTGCATSSGPGTTEPGTREVSRYAVIHEGPELAVALGFYQATRSVGDEWLIIAVELTASAGGGRVIVNHSDISVISPDGRRLVLVSQEEFRENYGAVRVAVERALRSLPILGRYDRSQMPCDRWFFVGPFGGFAYDEVPVNTFQLCSGPLVFKVPGGIQPGRWRLIIEQEESRVDVPFELEAEE